LEKLHKSSGKRKKKQPAIFAEWRTGVCPHLEQPFLRKTGHGFLSLNTSALAERTQRKRPHDRHCKKSPQSTAGGLQFQTITSVGTTVLLTWTAVAGRTYQLQFNTNLTQSSWITVTNIIATNSVASACDTIGSDVDRFYRVVLLP
jgi:hypothetical protein